MSTAISSFVTNFPAVGITTRWPPAVQAILEACWRFVTMPVEGSMKQVMLATAAMTAPPPKEGTAEVVVKA